MRRSQLTGETVPPNQGPVFILQFLSQTALFEGRERFGSCRLNKPRPLAQYAWSHSPFALQAVHDIFAIYPSVICIAVWEISQLVTLFVVFLVRIAGR